MTQLSVKDLNKSYGSAIAIQDVNFTVKDGEFVTLLGPSGCGKSTTLAAIAGLQMPTSGSITAGDTVFFDSERKIALPAEARDLGLVFQSYALWPHMSVTKNLRFPLQLRKVPKAEQDRRIAEVLSLVEMSALAERFPHELSGGQQQRVALARTLVYQPSILLLDEPLSNLDSKLRERARTWLGDIRDRIRLTTVYVTHDHGEALSLSDRIVVMNKGRIMQIDTPREIYERPTDAFVADFIGSSNFLRGTVQRGRDPSGRGVIGLENGQAVEVNLRQDLAVGKPVSIAVRPEKIVFAESGSTQGPGSMLEVDVLNRSYFGAHWHYEFDVGGDAMRVSSQKELPDGRANVFVPLDACLVFEASGGETFHRRAVAQSNAA